MATTSIRKVVRFYAKHSFVGDFGPCQLLLPGALLAAISDEFSILFCSAANTSHIVHELTFGPRLKSSMLKKIPFDVRANINPLEGDSFVNHFGHMSHEHNIKVVSTHYQIGTILGSSEIKGYQMAVSSHQYDADPNVPTARFSYDLAPTAVVISQVGRRWYEFFTSLCAIIGGMFTSFQILNGVMGSVTKHVAAPAPEILSPRPTSGVRSPVTRLSG